MLLQFWYTRQGNPGILKYQDTSTGSVVCELKTKLGACDAMTQNPHNAVIHLGHQNGTVTLWTPNLPTPHVKLLAHRGPVRSLAIDTNQQGYYMATSGLDGTMKVWDMRKWAVVNEWTMQKPAQSLAFSQKGLLASGWGNHVSVS
jgi:U3 small nucleolar RNA-associated protein 7